MQHVRNLSYFYHRNFRSKNIHNIKILCLLLEELKDIKHMSNKTMTSGNITHWGMSNVELTKCKKKGQMSIIKNWEKAAHCVRWYTL